MRLHLNHTADSERITTCQNCVHASATQYRHGSLLFFHSESSRYNTPALFETPGRVSNKCKKLAVMNAMRVGAHQAAVKRNGVELHAAGWRDLRARPPANRPQ